MKHTKHCKTKFGLGILLVGMVLTGIGSYARTYADDSATAGTTADIRSVKVRFCDQEKGLTGMKQLFIETKPAEKKDLCLDLINEGGTAITLGLNFVDGSVTADTEQKKACLPEGEKTNFGQFVTGYQKVLTIPAAKTVRTTAELTYPDGYAGDSYGCVTIHVEDANQQTIEKDGRMFQIFSRLGYFLDAFVDGDFKIDVVALPQMLERYSDRGRNLLIPIYRQGGNFHTRAELYNTGNITVSGDISIGYTARWVLRDSERLEDQVILPRQLKALEKTIPWYVAYGIGGPIKTKVAMRYEPVYRGKAAEGKPNQTYIYTQENNKFFVPRGVILLLLIIWGGCRYRQHRKVRKTTKRSLADI